MNRKTRKHLHTLAAILVVILTSYVDDAKAATAFLVSCQTGTSVTGRFVYVGTYQYGGRYFEKAFTTYCPQSIEVY